MDDSSPLRCIRFICLEDEPWTIVENRENVASFLHRDIAPDSGFLHLLDTPMVVSEELQLVRIAGKSRICLSEIDNGRIFVLLTELPFNLGDAVSSDDEIGVFLFDEELRLLRANRTFARIAGAIEEGNVIPFLPSRTGVFLLPVGLEKTHALCILSEGHGVCLPVSDSAFLRNAMDANHVAAWEYHLDTDVLEGDGLGRWHKHLLKPLHEQLRRGKSSCSGTFHLDDWNGRPCWIHVRYTVMDGHAYGVGTVLSDSFDDDRLSMQHQVMGSSPLDRQILLRADIVDDCMLYFDSDELKQTQTFARYSEWVSSYADTIPFEEERNRFLARCSVEVLGQSSFGTLFPFRLEYRCRDRFGTIRWVECRLMVFSNPVDAHATIVASCRYIGFQKQLELSLPRKAVTDEETEFYDCATMALMVDAALQSHEDRSASYTLAVLEISAIKDLSVVKRRAMLPQIAQLLRCGISARCFLGRFDMTHFVVFFEDVEGAVPIRNLLERLLLLFANAYLHVPVFASFWANIGYVVGGYRDMRRYPDLFEKASVALDNANAQGRNQVVSYRRTLQPEERPERNDRLDPEAQSVLLGCMDTALSCGDVRSAMPMVLSQVGTYYQAIRVCLLVRETDGPLEISASWEANSASHASGLFEVDPFRTALEVGSILSYEAEDAPDQPCMCDFPLFVGRLDVWNIEACYLVVVNPVRKERGLLTHAMQLISGEMTKSRLLERQEYLIYHDPMTTFRNFNGYTEFLSSFHEDAYSSLGMVSIGINDLREMNRNYGKERGNEIIAAVAAKIQEHFPHALPFRVSGAEFLLVETDLTYEAFSERIRKFSTDIRKQYPCSIAIGRSWSNTDHHLSVLFTQAELARKADRKNFPDNACLPKEYEAACRQLEAAIARGDYVIYLQPKFEPSTSRLCGAEALVRRIDPVHGIIGPGLFIEQLEQAGLIKYIDLFVLEQVCRTLRGWLDRNLPVLPISLNFSRQTLLTDQLVERMWKIRSRYAIPEQLVEIEITERFGVMDRNLVRTVTQAIASAGFSICIDDFGTEYSNLSTLTSLPLGVLKIDKSLVDTICTNDNSQVFVDGFVSICRKLGIRTVAEGVETENQLKMVSSFGCDMVQGFFYEKPIPVVGFEEKYFPNK